MVFQFLKIFTMFSEESRPLNRNNIEHRLSSVTVSRFFLFFLGAPKLLFVFTSSQFCRYFLARNNRATEELQISLNDFFAF